MQALHGAVCICSSRDRRNAYKAAGRPGNCKSPQSSGITCSAKLCAQSHCAQTQPCASFGNLLSCLLRPWRHVYVRTGKPLAVCARLPNLCRLLSEPEDFRSGTRVNRQQGIPTPQATGVSPQVGTPTLASGALITISAPACPPKQMQQSAAYKLT